MTGGLGVSTTVLCVTFVLQKPVVTQSLYSRQGIFLFEPTQSKIVLKGRGYAQKLIALASSTEFTLAIYTCTLCYFTSLLHLHIIL